MRAPQRTPSWLPMKEAPRAATQLALLCWLGGGDEDESYILIRARWQTCGDGGAWFDLDAVEAIDLEIVGWMPLPSAEERKALLAL